MQSAETVSDQDCCTRCFLQAQCPMGKGGGEVGKAVNLLFPFGDSMSLLK